MVKGLYLVILIILIASGFTLTVSTVLGDAGTLLQQLNCSENGYGGPVQSVAFSPDGSKLATSAWYESIWDVASGTKLQTLEPHDEECHTLTFSSDGSKLAGVTPFNSPNIIIFDVNSGEKLQWMVHYASLLAFRPNGTQLVTSDDANTISIWDVTRGANLQTLDIEHGPNDVCHALSFDGSKLATCNYDDRTTRIWDTTSGMKLQEIRLNHPAIFVAFNFDGSKLAISSASENKIAIWDTNSGEKLNEFDLPASSGSPLEVVAFSPDGSKLAIYDTYADTPHIIILDANSGKQLLDLKLNSPLNRQNLPFAIAFSPDGSKLATGQTDGYARVWEV